MDPKKENIYEFRKPEDLILLKLFNYSTFTGSIRVFDTEYFFKQGQYCGSVVRSGNIVVRDNRIHFLHGCYFENVADREKIEAELNKWIKGLGLNVDPDQPIVFDGYDIHSKEFIFSVEDKNKTDSRKIFVHAPQLFRNNENPKIKKVETNNPTTLWDFAELDGLESSKIWTPFFSGILFHPEICRFYKNEKQHRDNGPATIIKDGSWSYSKEGFDHNLNGPAIFFAKNNNQYRYFVWGHEFTKEKYEEFISSINVQNFEALPQNSANQLILEFFDKGKSKEQIEWDKVVKIYSLQTKKVMVPEPNFTGVFLNGDSSVFSCYKDGKLHREDGPAKLTKLNNGTYVLSYYENGLPHDKNNPMLETLEWGCAYGVLLSGNKLREFFNLMVTMEKTTSPEDARLMAQIYAIHSEFYFGKYFYTLKNSVYIDEFLSLSRKEAESFYNRFTNKDEEELTKAELGMLTTFGKAVYDSYKNGISFQHEKAALGLTHTGVVRFELDNNNIYVEYYKKGKLHNLEGPARVELNGNNYYYIEGHEYPTMHDWEIAVDQYKQRDLIWREKTKELPTFKTENDVPITFKGWCKFENSKNEIYHYENGKMHNDAEPAFLNIKNEEVHYKNGMIHREDGPAIISEQGERYYLDHICYSRSIWKQKVEEMKKMKVAEKQSETIDLKKLALEKDFSALVLAESKNVRQVFSSLKEIPQDFTGVCKTQNSEIIHCKDGKIHRDNGPAYITATQISFLKNGFLYNEKGPVTIYAGVKDLKNQYFLNGKPYTELEWIKIMSTEQFWDKFYSEITDVFESYSHIPKDFTGWCKFSKQKDVYVHCENGLIHKEGGPALFKKDGTMVYSQNGLTHNFNGPAKIHGDGTEEYCIKGSSYSKTEWKKYKIHYAIWNGFHESIVDEFKSPADVPANFSGWCKFREPGNHHAHYRNGVLHKEDGPAVIFESSVFLFYENGVIHNLKGPATGDPILDHYSYYINGKYLNKEEWENQVKKLSSPMKKELNKALLRGSVKRIKELLISAVAELLTQNITTPNARETAAQILKTPIGTALFSIALGKAIPVVTNKLPKNYHPYVHSVAQELAVSGGADIVYELSGPAMEILGSFALELKSSLDQLRSIDNQERLRIEPEVESEASLADLENMELGSTKNDSVGGAKL